MNNSGPAALAQPEIKRGEVAILLSTHGRLDMLLEIFYSLRATTVRKDKVALWLYVDDDEVHSPNIFLVFSKREAHFTPVYDLCLGRKCRLM